jgi:hypothetical protein
VNKKEREGGSVVELYLGVLRDFFLFSFWWWVSSSLVFVVGGGLGMWCGIWTRKFCLWWVI